MKLKAVWFIDTCIWHHLRINLNTDHQFQDAQGVEMAGDLNTNCCTNI